MEKYTVAVAQISSQPDKEHNYTRMEQMIAEAAQKGAKLIYKTVKSAVANALDLNKKLDEDMLFIKEIRVDEGPRLKRLAYRSRGRADMTLKRMCHITVVVDEVAEE